MRSKHKRLYIIIILIAILLLFAARAYYDTNSIEVKHYRIENSSIGEALSGLKVAHLSDFHIKNTGLMESKILETLKEERPDLIFIAGDLISFRANYEPTVSFLQQLEAPFGVYAVLGNTEYSNENGSCILCHQKRSKELREKQNPIFLRNSFVPLKISGKVINIIGVDDPVKKKDDLRTALKNMDPENPSILLAHSPEVFGEASGFGIDFLLAGHNHGGQIWITKFLRKILPLDPALEFLEGFFQKGKMLMYVSRGIGTSYLPFRFGVKPEITFFTFMTQQHRNTAARPSWSISNTPSKAVFTGLSLSNLLETFNIFNVFNSLRLTSVPQHPDTATLNNSLTYSPINSGNPSNPTNPKNSITLFDFESESELKKLNWECHKWFELSEDYAASGKHSLRVVLPPGQYPGIDFQELKKDWSKGKNLKMDIFNPGEKGLKLHIRIDDHKSGWEYANRFDTNFDLRQGMNHISIPADSIRTNIHHYPLNLKKIKRMMVFVPNNSQKRELYIDNIRLE